MTNSPLTKALAERHWEEWVALLDSVRPAQPSQSEIDDLMSRQREELLAHAAAMEVRSNAAPVELPVVNTASRKDERKAISVEAPGGRSDGDVGSLPMQHDPMRDSAQYPRVAAPYEGLVRRLEFIANNTHKVTPEEIEEVCDLAAEALERAEEDAERLDWLIDNCPYFPMSNGETLPENSRAAIDARRDK